MSREAVAQALDKAAEALAEAAHALRALEPDAARASVAASVPTGAPAAGAGVPPAPAPASIVDQGECPKHHRPWKVGQYGAFCSSQTDDPAWGRAKPDGKLFCKITPENAPQWLRIQAAA